MTEQHPFDRVLLATVHAVKELLADAIDRADGEEKDRLESLVRNLEDAVKSGGPRTWGM